MYILIRPVSSSEFDFNGTLQKVLRWIQTALVASKDFLVSFFRDQVKENPRLTLIISIIIFFGPWILLIPLFIIQGAFFLVLTIIGFGVSGIVGGSPAALYQSLCYGGHTPAASVFAFLQSTGASYNGFTVSNVVLTFIRVLAGLVTVYMILSMI
ncbi:hypothetical protein EDD18DRAFT_1099542 [Armillaria luteobubalina]|uniref:Uncharacterized protein n=1 Tax=Armillaria luteobubalina TaxID=153913 RepID=A0AA39V3P8_9AGAR|nr:hypothetical protein EDD18DRAFT_1099542 [Armillaria luteobubalina]